MYWKFFSDLKSMAKRCTHTLSLFISVYSSIYSSKFFLAQRNSSIPRYLEPGKFDRIFHSYTSAHWSFEKENNNFFVERTMLPASCFLIVISFTIYIFIFIYIFFFSAFFFFSFIVYFRQNIRLVRHNLGCVEILLHHAENDGNRIQSKLLKIIVTPRFN